MRGEEGTRRTFKPGRKGRERKRERENGKRVRRAITFARARLILICILIAVAVVIGGYRFHVSPAICREKKESFECLGTNFLRVSAIELVPRRFAPRVGMMRVADGEVSNRRAKGQTEKGRFPIPDTVL